MIKRSFVLQGRGPGIQTVTESDVLDLRLPGPAELLFGAIYSGKGRGSYNLYVQDYDDSNLSQQFIESMNGTGLVIINMVNTGLTATEVISDNSLTSFPIIPSGFGENLSEGRNATLEFRMDSGSQATLANYNVVRFVS